MMASVAQGGRKGVNASGNGRLTNAVVVNNAIQTGHRGVLRLAISGLYALSFVDAGLFDILNRFGLIFNRHGFHGLGPDQQDLPDAIQSRGGFSADFQERFADLADDLAYDTDRITRWKLATQSGGHQQVS
jgi:hypothetical protein